MRPDPIIVHEEEFELPSCLGTQSEIEVRVEPGRQSDFVHEEEPPAVAGGQGRSSREVHSTARVVEALWWWFVVGLCLVLAALEWLV